MNPSDPQLRLSAEAEILLLALFAAGSSAAHSLSHLEIPLPDSTREDVERLANELQCFAVAVLSPDGSTIMLTQQAGEIVRLLARERLTNNIRRQRTLEQQAEAILIWTLSSRPPSLTAPRSSAGLPEKVPALSESLPPLAPAETYGERVPDPAHELI